MIKNASGLLSKRWVPNLSKPEELRKRPPFVYSQLDLNQVKFDYEPDKDLIWAIADVIQKRGSSEEYLA